MKTIPGLLCGLCLLLLGAAAQAESVPHLYRGESIITGDENLPERARGFREAFAQVLAKASGDASLLQEERAKSAIARAEDYVTTFEYDNRHGRKINHEQGTRDKSFRIFVTFDQGKVDRLLGELGRKPWSAERPRLLLLLAVQDHGGRFVLADAGERGYGQREAALSIAARRGLPLLLPPPDAVSYGVLNAPESSALDAAKRASGADRLLLGRMQIDKRGYWTTAWRLDPYNRSNVWISKGVTFDRALADGIEGAARRLAQN